MAKGSVKKSGSFAGKKSGTGGGMAQTKRAQSSKKMADVGFGISCKRRKQY